MSRYGGPARDRSPPRFSDRRPSASHNIPPAHLSFRGGAEAGHTSSREIPRGPKADTLRHAGPPTPRGRGGFGPRPDFRDRDVAPSFRRETDRSDWPRRDRDLPVGDREALSSRDSRSLQSRDRSLSPNRVRREIKEAPPTAPRMSEPLPMWHGSGGRAGSLRARGRPDWDRGRGRPFLTERDGFGPRSRSRESWRDRDRDWERHDVDNRERFDRRDNERSLERDDRDAGWRLDRSPSRNSSGNQVVGPSRLNVGPPSHTPNAEPARRFSTTLTPAAAPREARRDIEKGDYFSPSIDMSVAEIKTRRAISPPSAPTVPAFGSSLEYVKPSKTQSAESLVASSFDKPPTVSQICKPVESLPGNAQDTPFQPPKGPKADRRVVAGALPYKEPKSFGSEIRAKQEIQPRTVRPFMSSTSTNSAVAGVGPSRNESWESFTGSGLDTKTLPHKQLSLKPGTSSTPSALSLKRSDPNSGKTLPPKTPPIIPTGPAAMESSPTSQRPNIPTGPRIQPKQYSHPWSAPGYKVPTGPTRPSIMNSAPSKPPQAAQRERNYGLPASHRNNVDPFVGQNIKPRVINKSPETDRSPTLHRRESFTHTSPKMVTAGKEMETSTKDHALLEISLARSSDEEVDDEDDGLDEEGFANSERKFRKEMDILAAKRPLSPLRDPTIIGLLVRIQLLAMIADGSAPSGIEAGLVMEEIEMEKPSRPLGLPSPAAEEQREESPEPAGRRLKDAQCNPIPTPPIEDLPFLSATIRDEQFFFGSSDDDEEVHETIMSSLCTELSSRAREAELNHMQLKEAFSNMYAPWRNAVSNMDRMKREENPLTPAPASPPVSIAPTVVPTPLIERTRGAKNITELDLQNILKASEQSAREEQERRDRELTSKPNYDMEAVIPIMMEQHEMESSFFEDRNQLVGEQHALDVFAFVPPQDDFTPEEQKAFIAAFNSHPKRWSDIADCLPGRDFQQCILHYYLTKHTAKYKDLWRKTLPKKKRGRGTAVRPRSTALMSDLVYEREEVDGTPAAVTDTGRPRRAAAPTFGEAAAELENAIIPAITSRRVAKESNGEQPVEKPTSRKRAGPKGPRRTKAAIGPVTGPSPQKLEKEIKAARANGKLDVFVLKNDEGFIPDVQTGISVDTEPSRPPPTLPKTSALDGTTSGRPLTTARNGPQQSSSYWSVPETNYFPTLVDYFGRDWAGISLFMETKTSNMVSNLLASNLKDSRSR
jgi:Myb-like DNA-binding domain